MTGPVDIATIVAGLADRTEELCRLILPEGVREGREWRVGSVGGEPGRSLAVTLRGARAGRWIDFGGAGQGDALELVTQVLHGGDKRAAIVWARHWLGLDTGPPTAVTPARAAQKQAEVDRDRADAEKRRRLAHRRWLEGEPLRAGDPVWRYLTARGLDMRELIGDPQHERLNALRFHPSLT